MMPMRPTVRELPYAIIDKEPVKAGATLRIEQVARVCIAATTLFVICDHNSLPVIGYLNSLRFGVSEQLVSPIPSTICEPDDITVDHKHLMGGADVRLDVLKPGSPYYVEFQNGPNDILLSVVLYGPVLT